MDARNDIHANVKPPPLDSDQLNYLIWRHLQESGYGDAAVRLQHDWNIDPQSLPFARLIKGRALVSLVQQGLRYYHLTKSIDQNGRFTAAVKPEAFFFGPDSGRRAVSAPKREVDDDEQQLASSAVRKHGRESGPNGASDHAVQPAPKRSRKAVSANGVERNGEVQSQPDVVDAMQVDGVNGFTTHHSEGARKSPIPADAGLEADPHTMQSNDGANMDQDMELDAGVGVDGPPEQEQIVEAAAPVYTLTNGHSVGVQITPAKVADLQPDTRIIHVADAEHVTRLAWRPNEPQVLAVSGEHFCGLWKISTQNLKSDMSLPRHSVMDRDESVFISAVAWNRQGTRLAFATHSDVDHSGQLRIFDVENNSFLDTLPAAQQIIMGLKWKADGSRLLGYTCDSGSPDRASTLLLWDLSGPEVGLSSIDLDQELFDIDWAQLGDGRHVCAAGTGVIYIFDTGPAIYRVSALKSHPANEDSWTFAHFLSANGSSRTVVAAAGSTSTIWLPSSDTMRRNAHDTDITALEVRPHYRFHSDSLSAFEFATASMDGVVKVWQSRNGPARIENLTLLTMQQLSPILALSWSLDGSYIAAASFDIINIWRAEGSPQPVATWEGQNTIWQGTAIKTVAYERSPRSVASLSEPPEPTHSLAWDSDSKKLAFGLGTQVAVMNFQR